MKDMVTFYFEEQQVRVFRNDQGEPWFVVQDVCEVLEHTDPHKAVAGLDDDEKDRKKVPTPGGAQMMWMVSESGLYTLIIRSHKPRAKLFRRWFVSEVAPALQEEGDSGDNIADYQEMEDSDGLVPFDFRGHRVRVYRDEQGEPWFVAKDVCDLLGHSNSRKAVLGLDDDEKTGVTFGYTGSGTSRLTAISESGLYSLIVRSNLPKAREFRKWVTSEVLPSIRRTGRYEMPGAASSDMTMDTDMEAAGEASRETAPARSFTLAEVRMAIKAFRDLMSIAREAGLSGSAAVQAANRGLRNMTGIDIFEMMGIRPAHLSPILAFVTECCWTEGEVGKADLYEAYVDYCETFGVRALNPSTFAKELRDMTSVREIRRNAPGQGRIRVWEGISLADGAMDVARSGGAESRRVH